MKTSGLRKIPDVEQYTSAGIDGLITIPVPLGPERRHKEVPMERDLKRAAEAVLGSSKTPSSIHDPLLVKQLGAESDDPVRDGELLLVSDEARYIHRDRRGDLTPKPSLRHERLTDLRKGVATVIGGAAIEMAGFFVIPTEREIKDEDMSAVRQISQMSLGLFAVLSGAALLYIGGRNVLDASNSQSWKRKRLSRQQTAKVVQ